MIQFKCKILVICLIIPGAVLYGQAGQASYTKDAEQLFVLARDMLAGPELQKLGYLDNQTASSLGTQNQLRHSCLFLEAAVTLDPGNALAWRELAQLYTDDAINDPNRAEKALITYNRLQPDNQEPIITWLNYRLNNLDNRQNRENFLMQDLNKRFSINQYPYLYSMILAQLGTYALEKGVIDNPLVQPNASTQYGARTYFETAFRQYEYNDQACAQMAALASSPAEQKIYSALRWRLRLRNNPYDLQALLNLIDTLESCPLHNLAQEYYQYAIALLNSVPPTSGTLPEMGNLVQQLRIRQLVGMYALKDYAKCLTLGQQLTQADPNNLGINALLAKSLQKLGKSDESQKILHRITKVTGEKIEKAAQPDYQLQIDFAWFLCFINPQPAEAINFAQNVNKKFPDHLRPQTILAYAYLLNQQEQQTQEILSKIDPNEPMRFFLQAELALARNDKDQAWKNFQQASQALVKLQPAELFQSTILLEQMEKQAKELWPEKTLTAPVEGEEAIQKAFSTRFSGNDLLMALSPEKAVNCSLRLVNDVYAYNDPIIATILLTNISNKNNIDTEIVLGPDNIINGHVVITAEIEETNATKFNVADPKSVGKSTPIVLTHKNISMKPILYPGQYIAALEPLNIGPLRQILQNHPQKSYRVTFRIYLDPILNNKGELTSRIAVLQPPAVTVTRLAFDPTQARMNSIYQSARLGTTNERVNAINLLTALLGEADLARKKQLNYLPQSIDEGVLRKIIVENLTSTDTQVRAWTTFGLKKLTSLNAQAQEIKLLSGMLSDTNEQNWFTRYMAVETLQSLADLTEYYQWAAKTEKNRLHIRQIQLFQGLPWQN